MNAVQTVRFPDLAGRVAIVTGASRGIGSGIAKYLGGQGMKLLLAARSAERGKSVAEGLARTGAECLWVTADLATAAGAQQVFDRALARFGRIDLLVNNAADVHSKGFLDLDEEHFHASCENNVRMVYGLSLLVARHMAAATGGAIVNISSVGGMRAHKRMAGYDAAKGAIDALTRSMAIDLARYGIRVNGVAPGFTRPKPHPSWVATKLRYIPLGRTAEYEDIAAAVAFLASDAASYITGQILYVDGGLTVQLTPPEIFV